jgi:arsenate reductase (thioredoxin)
MKKVLFVCVNNARRSQMAAIIFNHFAKKAKAESAGLFPTSEIDKRVIAVLQEIKIKPPQKLLPRQLTEEMLKEADLVISFGCLDQKLISPAKFREWQIEPPLTFEDFRQLRDRLIEKVKELIAENNF